MTVKSKHQKVSPETQEDALRMAKATQRPGQTKEQTKLIAQGIRKGIEQYKKQNKAKARELDKKLKKVATHLENQKTGVEENQNQINPEVVYRQSLIPWVLLIITWCGLLGYWLYTTP